MAQELVGLTGRRLVRTHDFDDLVSSVTELMSSHTVAPVRSGGFTAEVSGVRTPGLSLLEMDYGLAVRLTAEPLPGYVAVSLPRAYLEPRRAPGTGQQELPRDAYRRFGQVMIVAERARLLALRDDGRLGEDGFVRIQRELDLEQAALLVR